MERKRSRSTVACDNCACEVVHRVRIDDPSGWAEWMACAYCNAVRELVAIPIALPLGEWRTILEVRIESGQ